MRPSYPPTRLPPDTFPPSLSPSPTLIGRSVPLSFPFKIMADSKQTKSIRVRVMGREYALRVEADNEEFTRRIASSVDDRMRQFQKAHPEQAELTTAVMTALALAEELQILREEQEDRSEGLNDELKHLSHRLDEALTATVTDTE